MVALFVGVGGHSPAHDGGVVAHGHAGGVLVQRAAGGGAGLLEFQRLDAGDGRPEVGAGRHKGDDGRPEGFEVVQHITGCDEHF